MLQAPPRVRTSALITGIFLAIEMLGVIGLIVTGLWHPTRDLSEVLRQPIVADGNGNLVQVSLGALAIFNANIAAWMFYARMAFSLGRDEILPGRASSWLATVHAGSGVPRNATIAIGIAAAACCAFSTHAVVPLRSQTARLAPAPRLISVGGLAIL